jgi:hypothetical protein
MKLRWQRVHVGRRCAYGCDIIGGSWAWLGRWSRGRQFNVCRACGVTRYQLTPPATGRTAFDGKAMSCGRDA